MKLMSLDTWIEWKPITEVKSEGERVSFGVLESFRLDQAHGRTQKTLLY